MAKYKEITFAKGYDKSFAGFKKEFENTHVFKKLKPADREKELEKAYLIANPNGKLPTSKTKSAKADASKS